MLSDNWTDILTTQLTAQAKQIAHASHTTLKHPNNFTHNTSQRTTSPPIAHISKQETFYPCVFRWHPLQHSSSMTSPPYITRYETHDTFERWLWHCNALQTPRLLLSTRILAWAQLCDDAINSFKCSSATGRWRSYTLPRDLALQGTITTQLQATFNTTPAPFENPTDPHPITYMKDDAPMSRLVFLLETYTKLTNRTYTLALYGPIESFAF